MTNPDVPEADWKVFRELRDLALERFCARILGELDALRADDSQSHHERYLAIFELLHDRDQELSRAFNDPRRSRMMMQLAAMLAYGLVGDDELTRFTEGTRTKVVSLGKVST